MLTVCWAAKGGSGTTVTTVAMALARPDPAVVVDLAGDVPLVAGVGDAARPGVYDWIASGTDADRFGRLEQSVREHTAVVPSGRIITSVPDDRWRRLGAHLASDSRRVIVDAGTGEPPPALLAHADAALLVTRPCYLSLTCASRQSSRPTGVILVLEPGRALHRDDVERSLGAPVVATILLDPRIARAVDAGLVASRLPRACLEQLRLAA